MQRPWGKYLAFGAVLLGAAMPVHAQSSFAMHTKMGWDGVLTGIFLGLLVFSVTYNAAFFVLLRERFLVWQSARALTYLVLVIGLSPLMMGPWLTPDSEARLVLNCILFDLAIVVSSPFLRSYLETGTIGARAYRLLGWPPFLILATTPAMMLTDCPPAYMALRELMLLGMLMLCSMTVIIAIVRGSRTARYQAAAWSGIAAVFAISLFHDIVLDRPFEDLLFALFPALGLEVILTALGILDRLLRLRREREDARAHAESLRVIANTDPLTGLANRRAIEASFHNKRPAAFALIDLDQFKAINDRHGHDIGDKVIFAAAVALGSGSAVAGRIGGEEFALLLYGKADDVAVEAERLRARISTHVAQMVQSVDEHITASMGLAYIADETRFKSAMKAADISLYAAKHAGRNRAVIGPALAA